MVEREHLRWAGKAVVAVALLAVGCGESPVLRSEEYSTVDGTETLNGTACFSSAKGDGSQIGTNAAPGANPASGASFSATYDGTGDGVHFVVLDETGAQLAERHYDAGFLDSGKHDEVAVEPGGIPVRFVHWGAKACDSDAAQ